MRKITLAIQYMPYPHTGEAIQQALKKLFFNGNCKIKFFSVQQITHLI